jgi:hypothetical protein
LVCIVGGVLFAHASDLDRQSRLATTVDAQAMLQQSTSDYRIASSVLLKISEDDLSCEERHTRAQETFLFFVRAKIEKRLLPTRADWEPTDIAAGAAAKHVALALEEIATATD